MRMWVLNALVPPSWVGVMEVFAPRSLADCLEAAQKAAQEGCCFIGHPATAALLGVQPSRGEASPEPGDEAFVVRLRRRAAVPGDVEAHPEDLEVRRVVYRALGE